MIQLGVNSVLFGAFDFDTACRMVKASGYDGIEVSAIQGMCEHYVLEDWKNQAEAVKATMAKYELKPLSMEVAANDEARLELAFSAAAAAGIPVVNVGPGGASGAEGAIEASIENLKARAAQAESHGVTLCCKAHVGAAIWNTPTTLQAMAAIDSPAFGVDMDPSHIWRGNEDPAEALKQVVSRVKHVHIRDCKGRQQNPGIAPLQACGRGDIDLLSYLKVMVEAKYDGPVCLEVIGAGTLPLEEVTVIAAESYGYLNALLKSLGAR